MKVKICGVCRPADAAAAVDAGVDYIGVIVGASSARHRGMDEAAAIFSAAGGAARVGVFADASAESVGAAVHTLSLDVVQLHGTEAPAVADALRGSGVQIWKAVRPRDADGFARDIEAYARVVDGLLVEGWSEAGQGGVGARAPWQALAPLRSTVPTELLFVLAGGLTAMNVAAGIRALMPDVVDVSSGVESAIGEKSADRVRAFVAAARAATPSAGART